MRLGDSMDTIKFKATEDQIAEIGANAVNASKPVGLGHMSFTGQKISQARIFQCIDLNAGRGGLSLDYVQGRMVKLNIWKKGEHWEINDHADPEYQSWCCKYPTVIALLNSVAGVEIL